MIWIPEEVHDINKRISLMEIPWNHGPIILKYTLMELSDELKAHRREEGNILNGVARCALCKTR
jgi:hypothetical protein